MTFAEFFATNPALLAVIALAFGLVIGSFLNVVIYRLPIMMETEWTLQCRELLEIENPESEIPNLPGFNLATPNSHCPKCKHEISALENIPVLSWLLQGGKCRHCQLSISPRYPIIEMFTGIISALVAYKFGYNWLTLALLLLCWSLVVLTMIDFDHQLLPDDITLPLLWLGLLVNSMGMITTLESAVWGAIGGYGILWGVYWLFKLLTGKDGMGYGDFKLLGALGAWMGWQVLPMIILLSSLVGAVVGISLIIILGRDKNVPIPFGPYLASAGFIALLWNDSLTALYYSIFL
ncbi:MAG: A24 family peptidase [Gammaproteobacteria bacterium]|nr:A24 family peptidase [Gammaproteobacteria bacterium]